jgi:hypothetical protein
MKILLIILSVVILSSCVTEKKCNKKFPPQVIHTVQIVEKEVTVYKDTIIYVELPPVVIEKFVGIKDTLILRGNFASAMAWVKGANIFGRLKEGEVPVKIKYEIKEVIKDRVVIDKQVEIKIVKHVPLIYKIFSVIGLVGLVYLGFKIFK